jgi:hypothetical protein
VITAVMRRTAYRRGFPSGPPGDAGGLDARRIGVVRGGELVLVEGQLAAAVELDAELG